MAVLEGSSILVTGGTGSFGKAFTRFALEHLEPRRLVLFSRDELKQYEFKNELGDDPRVASSSVTFATQSVLSARLTGSIS